MRDIGCRTPKVFGADEPVEHDPEKWNPVSRLREARFDGRRKVGNDHAQTEYLAAHVFS